MRTALAAAALLIALIGRQTAAAPATAAAPVAAATPAPVTAPSQTPQFPAPPRLATSAAEWAAQRAAPEFAARRDAAVSAAAALLKQPVVVPTGAGDWVFYYACPDDGNSLNALSLTEHQCPRCKKIYSDDRTVAAYRTMLHDRANAAAEQLAWAYAYGGDDACARDVQRILLKLADDYAGYPARRDRWGRTGLFAQLGGRRYSQSLDEAVGVIKLTKAYDLTRAANCWTEHQRQHVETDLFRATADTLLVANLDINNHQTWFNAGLMCIASVLGDAKLVEKVLAMRGGFRDQLARSIDADGLWYEGTMAYQNYALQAMFEIVDAGRRLGLPLHEEPKFKLLLTGPLKCAYPNGQFPAINDSDPMGMGAFDASFQWAAKTYSDWPGKPAPPAETKSINLAGAGLAVLRRGTGDKAVCAMVDYGPHGGGHGHFDKLNIVLFANGREWLLDPGRIDYSHKEYKSWVKHTAAHNTVTLGGKSQNATTGKCLWFDVNDRYAACATRSDGAYSGAVLTRYLLLTDAMLVDVFTVEASGPTQIDLLAHAISEKVQPDGIPNAGVAITPGASDGYPHLASALAWPAGGGTSRWDFIASADLKLRAWFVAPAAGEHVIAATGIGYTAESRVPCLIRRVNGAAARFVTVYDLSGNGLYVKRVEAPDAAGGKIVVTTSDGIKSIGFTAAGAELTD